MITNVEKISTTYADNAYVVEFKDFKFFPKTSLLILVLCMCLMFYTCGETIKKDDSLLFIFAYATMMWDFCIAFMYINDVKEDIAENYIKSNITHY